jgi:hypothetical protein
MTKKICIVGSGVIGIIDTCKPLLLGHGEHIILNKDSDLVDILEELNNKDRGVTIIEKPKPNDEIINKIINNLEYKPDQIKCGQELRRERRKQNRK